MWGGFAPRVRSAPARLTSHRGNECLEKFRFSGCWTRSPILRRASNIPELLLRFHHCLIPSCSTLWWNILTEMASGVIGIMRLVSPASPKGGTDFNTSSASGKLERPQVSELTIWRNLHRANDTCNTLKGKSYLHSAALCFPILKS